MTRHTGSFQFQFLGLCPLLIDWKISLISLAGYVISGLSDMETDFSSRYSLIIVLRKSMQISLLTIGRFSEAGLHE